MKKLLVFLLCLLPLSSMASIVVKSADGLDFTYNILSGSTCSVLGYSGTHNGELIIPSSIQYKGQTLDVVEIGSEAFKNDKQVNSIIIPEGITAIGYQAFYNCSATNIALPSTLNSIGSGAFRYSKVKSIVIPGSVNETGNFIFRDSEIESAYLPDTWKKLPEELFRDCKKLNNVKLSENLTAIGKSAFYGCSNLNSINLPLSLTAIGELAFCDCTLLTNIVLPDLLTSIGRNAFRNTGLVEIVIPENVTSINQFAFYECSKLQRVSILGKIKSMDDRSFSRTTSLKELNLAEGMEFLYGFNDCPLLESVILPSTLTFVGGFINCPSLSKVIINAETPPTLHVEAFDRTDKVIAISLYVPDLSVAAYKENNNWSKFWVIKSINDYEFTPVIDEKIPCATPVISLKDGKLDVSCETPDVKINYTTYAPVITSKTNEDGSVTFSCSVTIGVYATADGYKNSETVYREIQFSDENSNFRGDVDGNGEFSVSDVVKAVSLLIGK